MKESVRSLFKSARQSISEINRERKSHRIFDSLSRLPEFKKAIQIMVYLSRGEEVVTHFMVKKWLDQKKKIYAPKVESDKLLPCLINHWEDLEYGKYNVLEPKETLYIANPNELELILVPGIAFTPKGGRIGMGKGFYDRFLSKTKAIKIALAYEEQISSTLPLEQHDIAMNIIITDKNIYRT